VGGAAGLADRRPLVVSNLAEGGCGEFGQINARPFKRYCSLATPQPNSLVKVNADVAWLILEPA
jgi:hypothetical protein